MPTPLTRESANSYCLFLENGKRVETVWADVYRRFGIQGVIRIHNKDYAFLPPGPLFTHFNLESSGHQAGRIYALPKIVIPGFFVSPENERLPVLDFSHCFIARCITTRERVPYAELTKEDFAHSFRHIQNVPELKKEMLWRYTKSLPTLTPEEILSRSVSITGLEIIKQLD